MLKALELPEGSYKKKVNTFLKESSALFSINKANIFDLIKSDKNRDDEAKKEDIKFLRLCLRGDMVKFGNMDNKFCENAHRAQEKIIKISEKIQRHRDKKKKKEISYLESDFSSTDSDNQTECDELYLPSAKSRKNRKGFRVTSKFAFS